MRVDGMRFGTCASEFRGEIDGVADCSSELEWSFTAASNVTELTVNAWAVQPHSHEH